MSDQGPGVTALSDAVRRVCERSLESVGVDGGGVTLATRTGHRATVCWTDPVSSRIEDLQFVRRASWRGGRERARR